MILRSGSSHFNKWPSDPLLISIFSLDIKIKNGVLLLPEQSRECIAMASIGSFSITNESSGTFKANACKRALLG